MAESPVDQLREMSMIHPRIGGAPQYLGNGPLAQSGVHYTYNANNRVIAENTSRAVG